MDDTARIPFDQLGNNLFCNVACTCPDPMFADSPVAHLMPHRVKLRGYADSYFFDTVNAEPRENACKCGRRYRYRWFDDGVEFAWIDAPVEAAAEQAT